MTEETKKHITLLKNYFGDKVKSILEVQCGDGYDIENCVALQDKNLNYIGVDVVDAVIQDNRQYFRYEKNKIFMILDASNEPLPTSDLVVCTNMMEYLPIANIWALLENIKDSGCKYVAVNYYHSQIGDLAINEDIKIPSSDDEDDKQVTQDEQTTLKRGINLTQAPFYFPLPSILFPTDNINVSVALYKIEDIAFYMEWHNDDISFLRSKLIKYIDEDLNTIQKAFSKHENGEQMFMDFVVNSDKLDWQKMYYDETVKNIVDKEGIFTVYIDFLLLKFDSDLKRLKDDQGERYGKYLTEENMLWANIITKDFIKFKYNLEDK